ncbi:2-amino-4-hydroxy-6-hydroxymethyldihydropteridine diphosphokinase [Aeoliella sp. ICT_H6.2]|uniref:2-amino-4-hydroxy-6-hydroxymethyldihydropteridine pyrophosphokinase n=1 Tax=Aeoliella straminimaris TaxID=2954799 RepID=A0A9X2JFH5_9BACT|nr:2-amino-4-hydroxy-6-hydroxymethyldihydropteridine diphosphokinase [Aeoliella straminimaris]MCO6044020.1 2-amino-4-hydroxy-6-hydroxymethyldihydropteridine diphosphokinase [Aeoliella straminimaris]
MPQVLVALGSNLGDSRDSVQQAIERLDQTANFALLKASSLHSTEPIGGPVGQGGFTNAVAKLQVDCSPRQLLTALHAIEHDFGRLRDEHWGPRTLDLDILLIEDRVVQSPLLEVPHPRMSYRPFMLDPAVEIAGQWRHPTLDVTLADLAKRLHEGDDAILLYGAMPHDRDWHARQLRRTAPGVQVAREEQHQILVAVGQPSTLEKPRLAIHLGLPSDRLVSGIPTLTLPSTCREDALFDTRAALRCVWPDLGREDTSG